MHCQMLFISLSYADTFFLWTRAYNLNILFSYVLWQRGLNIILLIMRSSFIFLTLLHIYKLLGLSSSHVSDSPVEYDYLILSTLNSWFKKHVLVLSTITEFSVFYLNLRLLSSATGVLVSYKECIVYCVQFPVVWGGRNLVSLPPSWLQAMDHPLFRIFSGCVFFM